VQSNIDPLAWLFVKSQMISKNNIKIIFKYIQMYSNDKYINYILLNEQ
jgi:hypothetical protein